MLGDGEVNQHFCSAENVKVSESTVMFLLMKLINVCQCESIILSASLKSGVNVTHGLQELQINQTLQMTFWDLR